MSGSPYLTIAVYCSLIYTHLELTLSFSQFFNIWNLQGICPKIARSQTVSLTHPVIMEGGNFSKSSSLHFLLTLELVIHRMTAAYDIAILTTTLKRTACTTKWLTLFYLVNLLIFVKMGPNARPSFKGDWRSGGWVHSTLCGHYASLLQYLSHSPNLCTIILFL